MNSATQDPAVMLTIRQVAKRMNVSVRTVSIWISEGNLAAVRIGRLTRISPNALNEMMEKHSVQSTAKSDA